MRQLLKGPALVILALIERACDFYTPPQQQIAERLKMLMGRYELGTTRFIKQRLRGGVAIDIGANVGYYATLMSKYATQVYAFEPDPDNFALLERNCRNRPNITPFNLALSDHSGLVDFYKVPDSAMRHSLIDEGGTYKLTVNCISLDEFVRERNIENINLIKIDVEGAEALVLSGMRQVLAKQPLVIVESAPQEGVAIADDGRLVAVQQAPRLGAKQKVTNVVLNA